MPHSPIGRGFASRHASVSLAVSDRHGLSSISLSYAAGKLVTSILHATRSRVKITIAVLSKTTGDAGF